MLYIEFANLCFCFCVIPVLLYSVLSAKYSFLHLSLKSSFWYHVVRQFFNASFSVRHLKDIRILLSWQHLVNLSASSAHFSILAISRIFFGIITSISTFLKNLSSGSPKKLYLKSKIYRANQHGQEIWLLVFIWIYRKILCINYAPGV